MCRERSSKKYKELTFASISAVWFRGGNDTLNDFLKKFKDDCVGDRFLKTSGNHDQGSLLEDFCRVTPWRLANSYRPFETL